MNNNIPTAAELARSLVPLSREAKIINVKIDSISVPYLGVRRGKEFKFEGNENDIIQEPTLMGIKINWNK